MLPQVGQERPLKVKRPAIITGLCMVGFLGCVVVFLALLLPSTRNEGVKRYGSWFPLLTGFFDLIGLLALIGYWKMRKWGVYLYLVLTLAGLVYAIFADVRVSIVNYLLPVALIVAGFAYLKRMT